MNTFIKRSLWSLGLAGCMFGAATMPGAAQVGVTIHLGPQPPPRVEHYGPRPRPGCFWGRGHYVARGHHWVWIPGHWVCR
jgi:hypothetical protein